MRAWRSFKIDQPWTYDIFGAPPPLENERQWTNGHWLATSGGVVRDLTSVDPGQAQTRDAFGYKWAQTETFSTKSPAVVSAQKQWHRSRFGEEAFATWLADIERPVVLDAGCGSGFSASILLESMFSKIRYVGTDISTAVEIAAQELGALIPESLFVQADMTNLPFFSNCFDCIVAEGTLHHTPSTKKALTALATHLRAGGIFMFYVYNKKGAIREFTDDYIRGVISKMSPEEGWKAVEPLTKLGIALGELKTEIDVPEDIPYLGITAGKVDIQRLFYYSVAKAFYGPEMTFGDMNHINFDWFAPTYAHRQTPEEVRAWCAEIGLNIEYMHVEQAGITVIARKSPP